jgi:UDP-glucose 4-epimerase
LELIQTFEEATLIKINHKIIEARPLDVAACYTNSDKSLKFLNWSTKRTLYESCKNAWGFKKKLNKVSQ